MTNSSFNLLRKKKRINENCILATNGFSPYERCSACTLKATQCMGMHYNAFILIISMLLLMFLFLENALMIRLNIAFIMTLIVVMGYRVMVNSDELTNANYENMNLSGQLKRHSDSLQDEILKQTKELKSLAVHDKLTGLFNRYEFEARLKNSLEDVQGKDHMHVLCYMDLDQFKIVNDTSGHVAGDELLKQLSVLLQEALAENAFISRLGGDEFGIIVYDSSISEAEELIQNVLNIIRAYRFNWEDKVFRVGASVGMIPINKYCTDLDDLLITADTACYIAKENGRNRIHVLAKTDPDMARHKNDMQWLEAIDQAINEDRFELYGQAIHAMRGLDDVPHFELLIRMLDAEGKIVDPMSFIPSAERYQKMAIIDRWVLKEAMFLLRELLDKGKKCQFSVNLSGQSFSDESFSNYIKNLFIETEIPYECICIEITETAAISNLASALKLIKELRALGCFFSLDDFGSGLSSFSYLKNIPVDYIKIDGQFVRDIDRNPINLQMVKSIHDIAKVMKIKTICEYVENKEVSDALDAIGIDYAQGDYFCVASSIRTCINNYNKD